MAEKMIGAGLKDIVKGKDRTFGAERFHANGLTVRALDQFGTSLDDVCFSVRAGEILGIAGVAGNGQNELMLALDGEVPTDAFAIKMDDKPVGNLHPSDRRKLGLCAVPEERNGHAAVGDFTLADNSVLTARGRLGMVTAGLIRAGAAKTYTGEVIAAFAVKALGPGATAGSLSGGNLQKYIMGREIMQKPSVLVVSQPTWGVDAGAAAAIHQAIVDLAASGSAVVVISQDLDELLGLCDTLAVINGGRLSQKMVVGDVSIEEIGLLMGGVHGTAEETHIAPGAAHAVPA
jgi:simple sugar transport system ATP-binding protein